MAFNSQRNISAAFRLNATIRIAALSVTLFLVAWLFAATEFYAIGSLLALSCILQAVALFHHVDRTNRELAGFIASVTEGDFANLQDAPPGKDSFQALRSSFINLADKFSALRSDREAQAKYLDAVTRHIPVPLIALGPEGNVTLINNAARRLLGVADLTNIRHFEGFGEGFPELIRKLRAGSEAMVDLATASGTRKLSVRKTLVSVQGGTETLISLNDINRALDAAEVDAWRKLTQVLTHEIMNSVTPITSMSETMLAMLKDDETAAEDGALQDALEIVADRSRGLLKFVQRYREVTRVPVPNREQIPVQGLFETTARLVADEAKGAVVIQEIEPASLAVHADPELLTQSLLNLLKNALDATEGVEHGQVTLSAHLDKEGRSVLSVKDNGCGIPEDKIDKVFIPFFTTKAEGSGVGLSLTRMIVQAHGGTISIQSRPDEGTTISLTI